mgnify:CR=1 FL=1
MDYTRMKLPYAVYGLYADEACRMLVAQFPKTGSDGTAELKDLELTQDVYYVKEQSAPAGYCVDERAIRFRHLHRQRCSWSWSIRCR